MIELNIFSIFMHNSLYSILYSYEHILTLTHIFLLDLIKNNGYIMAVLFSSFSPYHQYHHHRHQQPQQGIIHAEIQHTIINKNGINNGRTYHFFLCFSVLNIFFARWLCLHTIQKNVIYLIPIELECHSIEAIIISCINFYINYDFE